MQECKGGQAAPVRANKLLISGRAFQACGRAHCSKNFLPTASRRCCSEGVDAGVKTLYSPRLIDQPGSLG